MRPLLVPFGLESYPRKRFIMDDSLYNNNKMKTLGMKNTIIMEKPIIFSSCRECRGYQDDLKESGLV